MSCEHVRESLLQFLGDPSEPLPAALRTHLDGCAACKEELAEMRDTWEVLGRIAEVPASERMHERFHAMLAGESAGVRKDAPAPAARRIWIPRPALQAGLLAATLVAGVLLGNWISSRQASVGEIEELRAEMRSMTHAVTMSLLLHQSASERLRAIGLCDATPPDQELVQALLRVVNDDPSANVRLAALDVLASVPVRPEVRAGLIESFPRQESSSVTAAMAAILLEVDGAGAVEAVRRAAVDERQPDSVRRYLLKLLAEHDQAKGSGT